MLTLIRIFVIIIVLFGSIFGWRTFRQYQPVSTPEKALLEERLKNHVKKLSYDIGERSIFMYEKLNEAALYITNEFKSYGYKVEFHAYQLYGKKTENIIAEKRGDIKPDEIIIVGAHYDTCFNPGADDNASGIAGLLELARIFSDKPTACTIRFIAFANEEPPFFKTEDMGSFQYIRESKKKNEKIRGAVILEMIGFYSGRLFSQRYPPLFGFFYPNRANFIAVISNFHSRKLAGQIKKGFREGIKFPIESVSTFDFIPGVDFSDNWSFWKNKIPAVMITDTAFYRYPHYHSDQDTYEKLDYKSISEVIIGLYSAINEPDNIIPSSV